MVQHKIESVDTIYYYHWISPEPGPQYWYMWLDYMLTALDESLGWRKRLVVCINMPMYWMRDSQGYPFIVRGKEVLYKDLVEYYITEKYPFVDEIIFRDSGLENIYEGFPLSVMWGRAKDEGSSLYLHDKGITASSPYIKNWMEIIIKKLIDCDKTKYLNKFDVVALREPNKKDKCVSGNMFWASNAYIRTLPDPMTIMSSPNDTSPRYKFERWVMLNNPRIKSAYDILEDPYHSIV